MRLFFTPLHGLTQQQWIDAAAVLIDGMVNSTEVVVYSKTDEFREGRTKSVVVPEIIDAVRQLILQYRQVTYHEIETTLGISGGPTYIQYCMNI